MRDFDAASTHYLEYVGMPITGYPFTMAAWVKVQASSGFRPVIALINSGDANKFAYISEDPITSPGTDRHNATVQSAIGTSGNSQYAQNVAGATQSLIGVFKSQTSRTVYFNGTAGAENTNDVPFPTGLDRIRIGRVGTGYFDGPLGEIGLWNTELDATQLANIYTRKTSMKHIAPDNLQGYWRLLGWSSPEPDLSGHGRHLTLVSAPPQDLTNHPSIAFPIGRM